MEFLAKKHESRNLARQVRLTTGVPAGSSKRAGVRAGVMAGVRAGCTWPSPLLAKVSVVWDVRGCGMTEKRKVSQGGQLLNIWNIKGTALVFINCDFIKVLMIFSFILWLILLTLFLSLPPPTSRPKTIRQLQKPCLRDQPEKLKLVFELPPSSILEVILLWVTWGRKPRKEWKLGKKAFLSYNRL